MSVNPSPSRGRRVVRRRGDNSQRTFFLVIGAILLIGITILVTIVVRNNSSSAIDPNAPATSAPVGITEDGFYYKGDPEAPVKVIKYSDYQCPACKNYVDTLASVVDENYIATGQVQFIYHEFPLQQHQFAVPAAVAARCAGDQGKYWEMHNVLFARQGTWSLASGSPIPLFSGYAGELGLNAGEFDSCMASDTYASQVAAAGQAAIDAQVPATPTFMVNGQMVGATGLTTAIEAALRSANQ